VGLGSGRGNLLIGGSNNKVDVVGDQQGVVAVVVLHDHRNGVGQVVVLSEAFETSTSAFLGLASVSLTGVKVGVGKEGQHIGAFQKEDKGLTQHPYVTRFELRCQ